VRPDIAIVSSVSPSFSEDQHALATLRAEIAVLCDAVMRRGGGLLLCGDDPSLAALSAELGGAWCFRRSQLVARGGQAFIECDGTPLPVTREFVGDSNLYGLIVAARVAYMLDVPEDQIRAFLRG
jgi:hypothetical protein